VRKRVHDDDDATAVRSQAYDVSNEGPEGAEKALQASPLGWKN